METKYRVFRFKPLEGRGGSSTRQSRVIALPEGFPKPVGAEDVAAETPLSEWEDITPAEGEEN
jgi:hypothetical protein